MKKKIVTALLALFMLLLLGNFLYQKWHVGREDMEAIESLAKSLEKEHGGTITFKEIVGVNEEEKLKAGGFEWKKDDQAYPFMVEFHTEEPIYSDNLHSILTNRLLFRSFVDEFFGKEALSSGFLYHDNQPWGVSQPEKDTASSDKSLFHADTDAYKDGTVLDYLQFKPEDDGDHYNLNIIVMEDITEAEMKTIGKQLYQRHPYHGYLNVHILKDESIHETYQEMMTSPYRDMSLADFQRRDFSAIERIQFIPTDAEQPIVYEKMK